MSGKGILFHRGQFFLGGWGEGDVHSPGREDTGGTLSMRRNRMVLKRKVARAE